MFALTSIQVAIRKSPISKDQNSNRWYIYTKKFINVQNQTILMLYCRELGLIWYHSEPSDVPYSQQ